MSVTNQTESLPFLAFDAEAANRAHTEWKCNCGPAALAACLGWTLEQVRPHLGDFERRGYVNVTMMRDAIAASGHRHYDGMKRVPSDRHGYPGMPDHGLIRIQWGIPGIGPGIKLPVWASNYTHWIATKFFERHR